jgi:hypothetical protein
MGNTREDAEKEVKDFFATVKPLSIEEMEHTWGRNYYVHFKTKRGLGKKLVYTKSEAKDLFDALKDLSGQKNLIGLAKFSIRKYDYSDSGRFYVVDENDNAINKKTGKVYGGKQTLEYVFQNKNDAQHFADKLNEEYKKEDFDYYSFFYDHNSKQVKIEQGFVKDAILNGSKRECEIAKKSYPKLKYKIGDTLETKNNGKATVVNLKMEIWANKEGYVSEYFVVYENYFRTNAGEKYKVTGVERIGTDDVYESSKNNQFADGGQMEVNDINSELEDFDLDELDPFETMQFNHHIKSSGKVGALQVLINSVEGDYSQLSPALAELAEMQMSSEEYDEAGKQMRFERDGYANGGMTGLEYKNSPQYKELKDKRNRLYAQLKSRVVRAVGLDSAMEFYDADLKIAPYRFLERAVTGNFISLDEVNQRLIDSAMEEAEEIDNDDDLEEIGSSDFTYYLKSVLDGAGFKVGFVGSTLKRLNEDGSIKQINNGFFEDGGFMNGVYAKGGELQGKFLAEIGVPYNFEYVVEDEYEFSRFLSKALTNKFNFGNGAWGIKIVKPLFEKNYGQKIVVEIEIPVGVTQSEGLSKFDVLEFMSKTLTKKWFGNGVWNVDVVNSYANGGSMNSSGEITINKRNFDVIVMPKKLEIEVQITRADTVDQYGLNDAEVEWHQERWGYVIKADDNKKFNKALRVLGITQKFADGGFMADVYANGGGVGKENIRIVNTSRVTGGMNPTIRFNFSDGTVLKTKSDGYGVEYEKEVYQDLISKWFDSDDDYELGGVEDAKYADGAMLDDNEGFMKADNENNYRYPEMEVYVETIDEPIDLTNKVSRISGKVDTLDEPIDLRSNVSRRTNDVVIRTLDESADLNDDKRVRARMSYNPKDRNPDKLLSVNPRAFEFIKDLPTPTSNTHKND